MKLLLGLLVSLAISSAFALPARSPKDEVDVVEVPHGPQRSDTGDNTDAEADPDFKDFKGIVDTGAGYPFLDPLPRPFSFNLGFFDSFDDIFRRLRTRLWSVDSDSDETSEEGGFGLGLNPMSGANTTSVVKVVDGHKIEINDTVIGNGDGHGGALFKFRIINIRPLESGEEVPEGTQAPKTELETTPKRDIEGNSDETKSSEENEINANVDDPESTTEAITTEMLDTGIPSMDNNAIDNDSLVNQDEVQGDAAPTTEGLDTASDATTLNEDAQNPDGNTIKSEQTSEVVDAENVNEESIKSESLEEEKEGGDGEINESIVVNQNAEEVEGLVELLNEQEELEALREKQMQALVESVGEKLSMADADEERFAEEVEKMVSANDEDSTIKDDDDDEAIEEATQKPSNQQHSLREDLSSSDEEDVNEGGDNSNNEGLDSEWGGASLDDKNILTNEIDVYESVPIDLSNDVAINDIMADQGAPANPDAELFNVEELAPSVAGVAQGIKQFEVLSDIK